MHTHAQKHHNWFGIFTHSTLLQLPPVGVPVSKKCWLDMDRYNTQHILLQVVPGDDTVLRGKSKGGGCTVRRSTTALVIGIWAEPVTPGDCNVIVENLGDYLVGLGY